MFLNIILGRIIWDWYECMFIYIKVWYLKFEFFIWLIVFLGLIVENVNREIKILVFFVVWWKSVWFNVYDLLNIIRL